MFNSILFVVVCLRNSTVQFVAAGGAYVFTFKVNFCRSFEVLFKVISTLQWCNPAKLRISLTNGFRDVNKPVSCVKFLLYRGLPVSLLRD